MINYERLYHKVVRDIGDAIYTIEHSEDSAESIKSQVLDMLIQSISEAEDMYLDMCEEAYPDGEDLEQEDEDI